MTKTQTGKTAVNLPQLIAASLHLLVAMVILFSAVWHEKLAFTAAVFAGSAVVLALSYALFMCKQNTGVVGYLLLKIILGLACAVFVLLPGVSVQAFTLTLLIWAAGHALINLLQVVREKSWQASSKLLTLLPLILALGLLVNTGDIVAAIGWFGAYAVVYGVFGAIGAFDSARGHQTLAAQPVN